jgi:hypothetical protein
MFKMGAIASFLAAASCFACRFPSSAGWRSQKSGSPSELLMNQRRASSHLALYSGNVSIRLPAIPLFAQLFHWLCAVCHDTL